MTEVGESGPKLARQARVALPAGEWQAAGASAQRFERGRASGLWDVEACEPGDRQAVFDALRPLVAAADLLDLGVAILGAATKRAAQAHGDDVAMRQLAEALKNVADAQAERRDFVQARAVYVQGLEIWQAIFGFTGLAADRREIAVVLGNIALIDGASERLTDAEAGNRAAVAIMDDLARCDETPAALRDKALACKQLGDTMRGLGRMAEARQVYAESLDGFRALGLAAPGPEAELDIAAILRICGESAVLDGDRESGCPQLHEARRRISSMKDGANPVTCERTQALIETALRAYGC